MVNYKKNRFILLLTLIALVLLSSSCSGLKISPLSMEARAEILLDNQEQYTQFAELLLENATIYSQEVSEHGGIAIVPLGEAQKKENRYIYYWRQGFAGYRVNEIHSRLDPVTGQPLENSFENLSGEADIRRFLLDHPVYLAGADQGSNTAYVSLYEDIGELFLQKRSEPVVPKEKIQNVISFRYYADGNAVNAEKYDPKCSVLNDNWVVLSPMVENDTYVQRSYEDQVALQTAVLKDLAVKGYTAATTKKTTIELPFLSTVKQWTEESSITVPSGLEYIYEIDNDNVLLVYEREKQIYAVLLNWRTGQTVDQIKFTQGMQDYPAYFLERLNETTFAYAPRQSGYVPETLTLFTVENQKIAELYSMKLPIPALWRQSKLHFTPDLSLCAYIDEEKNAIQVCQVGKHGELTNQKTYSTSQLDTSENTILQELKFVDNEQLVYTWVKKVQIITRENGSISEGFAQLGLITNQIRQQICYKVSLLKASPGRVWVDYLVNEGTVLVNHTVSYRQLIESDQVTQIDDLHFAPVGANVFFSSQGEFFASRAKISSEYILNSQLDFPLAFAWYHLQDNEWEKEFWLIDFEDVLQSPQYSTEGGKGGPTAMLGDNSLLAATSSYAQRMYFVGIKGENMVLTIVEKP